MMKEKSRATHKEESPWTIHSPFSIPFSLFTILSWLLPLPALALPESNALMALERARYLHDILGERQAAKSLLQEILSTHKDKAVVAKANYYLGALFDGRQVRDSAVHYYREALKIGKLDNQDLEGLYTRLAKLNPESIQAVSLRKDAPGKVVRDFRHHWNNRWETTVQFSGHNRRGKSATEILHVDGEVHSLPVSLETGERLLDALGKQVLIGGESHLKVVDHDGNLLAHMGNKPHYLGGFLLHEAPPSVLVLMAGQLEVYRNGTLSLTLKYQGSNCTWSQNRQQDGQQPRGLLSCREGPIYRVNLEEGALSPVKGLQKKPYFAIASGQNNVIQYEDSFEFRQGGDLGRIRWKAPSKLSDKILLGNNTLYVLDSKGSIRALSTESGQTLWEKDFNAYLLFPGEDELVVFSHAQAILGVDRRGDVAWTYEYGWDSNVFPVVGDDYLVLFFDDGRRIHLNLDLIHIANSTKTNRLQGMMEGESNLTPQEQLQFADQILKQEPGNGKAWELKHHLLEQQKQDGEAGFNALVQAARSISNPPWTHTDILETVKDYVGSLWIWKRSYGQKYYPSLVPHLSSLLYLENNNQTLMLIHQETGKLMETLHVPEELDSKLLEWVQDKIIASSPDMLYLIPTGESGRGTQTFALKNPICKALLHEHRLFISDWFGNLMMMDLRKDLDASVVWRKKVSGNGLLLHLDVKGGILDVVDIEGKYFQVEPATGKVKHEAPLKQGTITEIAGHPTHLLLGYDDGMLLALDRNQREVTWKHTFPDQIFSLDVNRSNTVVVTTSTKRLYCLDSRNGGFLSETSIKTSLINKPLVTARGYWLGTTQPALEFRNFNHQVLRQYPLTDKPGNPVLYQNKVFLSTLDGLIFAFPH